MSIARRITGIATWLALVGCGSTSAEIGDGPTAAMGGAPGGTGGSSGSPGLPQDAGQTDAAFDASPASNCAVVLQIDGLAHTSTAAELKKVITIPEPGPSSWQSMRVELDVHHAGWSPKQGQYEVFTLLRSNKWVGNAIGYIAFVGPSSRKTVMVSNLNLPYAAAPDGRRITKDYPYEPNITYHLDYIYDVQADLRELVVSVGASEVTRVTGKVSVPLANPPVTSIEVPSNGFTFLMGGQESVDGPDCATLNWKFSNVRITGCH